MKVFDSIKAELNGRRRLAGFLVRPRKQLVVGASAAAVSALFLYFMVATFALQMKVSTDELAAVSPEAAQRAWEAVRSVLGLMFFYASVLTGFTFFMGVVLSHRIYGPLVPILRQIESLRTGNDPSPIHLRRGDELFDVASALNRLSDAIQASREASEGSRIIRKASGE